MSYDVYLKTSAEKELGKLPADADDKIVRSLLSLKNNPRPRGAKALRGREGYRIRVSQYRVLYLIDDKRGRVDIVSIAHRKEAYR